MMQETLIPKIGVVTDIRIDTPDIKTFRVVGLDGKKVFEHMPGQCAMLSIPGVGEAMFSITSSPTNTEYMEFSIKKCGCLTTWLHAMDVGQQITIRGPYGKHFPVEDEFKGKDLMVVAGGVGKVMIVYVSRSKEDLLDYNEILSEWMQDDGVEVHLTIDRPQDDWDGHVGFVPNYVKELNPSKDYTVIMCGPPIMIKFTLANLKEMGFAETQVYTTMELRMKCGVGKCGRCNIGSKYVCKDGPVFRFDQLDALFPPT